jgi:hypothetical protein
MIPAEACPGTFVTLKGACGKTTNNKRTEKTELTKSSKEEKTQFFSGQNFILP